MLTILKKFSLQKINQGKLPKIFKKKYLIAPALVIVLTVSMFAYFSRENPSTSESTPPETQSLIENNTSTNSSTNPATESPPPNFTEKPEVTQPPESTPKSQSFLFSAPLDQPTDSPAPSGPLGPVGKAQNMSSSVWREVAENAWKYFQPGVGVHSETGLPSATLGFPHITDWDIGVYIQAVINAEKIGLISKNGTWGADDRLEKILTFLETRTLNSQGLPFWWYSSNTGWAEWGANDITDTGRLLVALNNLKMYNSSLTERVDNVTKVRPDYSVLLSNITSQITDNSIYGYIVASGFAAFWPEVSNVPDAILSNLMASPTVETYGVQLPVALISCDPLLIGVLDLPQPDQRLLNVAQQVYLAHEARYNQTKAYVAFAEGMSGYGSFIYEWVVTSDGRTWVVHDQKGNDHPLVKSNVYTKIALSFLSIYKTDFARNMVIFLENNTPQPTNGYCDGVNNSDPNSIWAVRDVGTNTNGLILSAARYSLASK